MLNSDIPVKTSKGIAALGKRDGSLPQLMRSLLLLVNGRFTVERYAALLPNYGDIGLLFSALEQQGLVASRERSTDSLLPALPYQATPLSASSPRASAQIPGGVVPKPPVQNHSAAPAAKHLTDTDISIIRSGLLDLFSARLGYHALDLMLKLESAHNTQSLLATRDLARSLFASTGADWKPAERLYDRLGPA
jgi:hypothetical protein